MMATDKYPGRDYPTLVDYIPAIYMSRIDPTNSQIEITVNTMYLDGRTIAKIGSGFIRDHSEPIENRDILTYEFVDPKWSTVMFNYDMEEIETYFTREEGTLKVYTVNTSKALSSNTFKRLYYIVDFTDGTKWVNNVNYMECGKDWVMGKSCDAYRYEQDKEYDNVRYLLADAPEKFIKPDPKVTSEPESTSEPETTPELEPTAEMETVLDPEPIAEPESTQEVEPILESDSTPELVIEPEPVSITEPIMEPTTPVIETVSEVIVEETPRNNEIVLASAPQIIDTVKVEEISTDTDDEVEDVYDVLTESPDGPGETTLDIPLLGKSGEEASEIVEMQDSNWLLIFIAGVTLGAISTWFLFSLINRYKYKRDL